MSFFKSSKIDGEITLPFQAYGAKLNFGKG